MHVPKGSAVFSAKGKFLGHLDTHNGINNLFLNKPKAFKHGGILVVYLSDDTMRGCRHHWVEETIERLCHQNGLPPIIGQPSIW